LADVFKAYFQQYFDLFRFFSHPYGESVIGSLEECVFNVYLDFRAFQRFMTCSS